MRVARFYAEGGKLYERLAIDPEKRREVDIRRGNRPGRKPISEHLADELNKAAEWGAEVQQARIRRELGIRDR